MLNQQGLRDNVGERGLTNARGAYVRGFLPAEALEEEQDKVILPAYMWNSNYVDFNAYNYDNEIENVMNHLTTMTSNNDVEVIHEIKKPNRDVRQLIKKSVYDNFPNTKVIKKSIRNELASDDVVNDTNSLEWEGWKRLICPLFKPVSPKTKERNQKVANAMKRRQKAHEFFESKKKEKEEKSQKKIKKEDDIKEIKY